MKTLTVSQLKEACKKHKYLLLRFPSCYQMAVNTKVADLALKKAEYNDNDSTDFISYLPCDFQTYISKKHPFIK